VSPAGEPAPPPAVAFEGRILAAGAGQSLAAVLTAAGVLDFRETGSGARRGLFCGMGVCQDCLVVVDGVPNQRACMVKVTRPMAVARQLSGTPADPGSPRPPVSLGDYPVERPAVLVVGGGAGGMAAALAARQAGAEVVLLDERAVPGGQYYKQPAGTPGIGALDAQQAEGRRLVDRVRRSGAAVIGECEVWGAFPGDGSAAADLLAVTPRGPARFRPVRLIVAAGAYERGLPVPGWTLPGVMTTGAAQTLWRTYRVLPGRRILVAGHGPLNLQVASELARAGATVVAVAEVAAPPGPGLLGPLTAMSLAAPGLVRAGLRYRLALARHRAPVLYRHVVTGIEAAGGGLRVTLGRLDGRRVTAGRRLEADVVCLGYGFQPANEILRALGAAHDHDPARGHLVTRRDDDGQTTVPGVYGVGDCCGLGGAWAAREEGHLAGLAVARSLGLTGPGAGAEAVRARRRLARARRFEQALERLFAGPRFDHELADPGTVVCRCEEVSLGSLEAALADGRPGIGEVKLRTRAGMGRCQGRYCAPVLVSLLADRQGRARDELAYFAPRAPVKPVAVADLARLAAGPPDPPGPPA
jgi:NADPH-dependent 2,4-dienoyl-CoA reductase/sulfur reductase-like enzyme